MIFKVLLFKFIIIKVKLKYIINNKETTALKNIQITLKILLINSYF